MTRTRTFSASAWAADVDAVGDAVASASEHLGGAGPGLVLLFPDTGMSARAALDRAAAAAPSARLAGMTTEGLITRDGVHHGGCAIMAFGPEVGVGVGMARDASRDLREAGRAAAEAAVAGVELHAGRCVVLLFMDPMSGDQAAVTDGAYAVTGGRVPLAGGGANGPDPCLLADGAIAHDSVVAVALSSPEPISVGVAHGCRPCSAPSIATQTDGRTVLELNGRPAEEVYLEGLGCDVTLDDAEFEALAVLHPLAQPELRGPLRLRHVIGRAPGGGLACATTIPPNAAVWLTEQTDETIIASAGHAVREAIDELAVEPGAVLVFDCAARKRALGPRLEDEAAVVLGAVGGELPVCGVYTRGEVGRTRGAKGDRNHAIVVVALA